MKKVFPLVVIALLILVIIVLLSRDMTTPGTPTEAIETIEHTDTTADVSASAPASPSSDRPSSVEDTPIPAKARQTTTIINGITLSETQKQIIRDTYGVEPVSGNFWYDNATGAFGTVGQGISGIMLPGHSFGTMRADASGGTSGVYINGRQLTNQEVAALSAITGSPGVPGRYWMDALGNVGIEGSAIPLLNLYALAGAAGGSGGGDNFWSSSFSAGNYGPGNTYGYVSVPGVGPVDYGF